MKKLAGTCPLCGFPVSINDTRTETTHNLCLKGQKRGLDIAALVSAAKRREVLN